MTQEPLSAPQDDPPTGRGDRAHPPEAVQTLRRAMRRARFDDAERTGAIAELRAMRIGRLEILHEALRPLIAQIPTEVDLFDVGLMPGANPRLFIDMIGFIEMGRDAHVYHFIQDTRHGRTSLAESSDVGTMVEAVTDYVARRLLERDKALAADAVSDESGAPAIRLPSEGAGAAERGPATAREPRPAVRMSRWRWLSIGFAFLIDLLGSIAFFTILAAIGWVIWNKMHVQL